MDIEQPEQETSHPVEPPRDWTTEEAAKYLNKSPMTVRRMIKDGRLLGYKKGRQWFVKTQTPEIQVSSPVHPEPIGLTVWLEQAGEVFNFIAGMKPIMFQMLEAAGGTFTALRSVDDQMRGKKSIRVEQRFIQVPGGGYDIEITAILEDRDGTTGQGVPDDVRPDPTGGAEAGAALAKAAFARSRESKESDWKGPSVQALRSMDSRA